MAEPTQTTNASPQDGNQNHIGINHGTVTINNHYYEYKTDKEKKIKRKQK